MSLRELIKEFAPDGWVRPDQGKIPVRPQSWVIGLFGKKGAGKSIVMCDFGIDAVQQGRPVFYYPRDYGFVLGTPMDPAELVQIPEKLDGALIMIDEIQELLSKYRTNTLASQQFMALFRQVRKRNCNVVFTSNDPGSINSAVSQQTDIHGFCSFWADHRCESREYHLKSCEDTVVIRWRDTHGRFGINPNEKDGRKIYPARLDNVKRFYGLYNTESIADPVDVYGITKRSLMNSKAEEKLGMTWMDFDELLRSDIVPSLVLGERPVTQVVPGGFAKLLMRERKIDIDSTALGIRLQGLGLAKKRNRRNSFYALPPPNRLQDWQDGLWDASDPEE